jgi:hypothetical protein
LDAFTTSPALRNKVFDRPSHYQQFWRFARFAALIGVFVAAGSRLHHGEIRAAFARLTLVDIAVVTLVLSPLGVLLRSLRWRYLLPEGKDLPLRDYIGAYLVGVLANSLLLGRLGDLVKARFISGSRLAYARSLAIVAIDRVLEGIALLLIFLAATSDAHLPRWSHKLAWIAGLASIGILIALWLASRHRERFLHTIEPVLGHLPSFLGGRALVATQRLVSGCEVLEDYRRVVITLLYAVVVWGVEIVTVMIFLSAFSIARPWVLPAIVVLVVLNFGMLVPISPGAVGVYQLLCSFALSLWGVTREVGFSLGIAMQTILFLPLYSAAAIWLLVSLRSRGQRLREATEEN